LKEQIAELLPKRFAIARIDGVDDLAGFFEDVLAQRRGALLAVPRTTVGGQEALHDLDQPHVGFPALLGERGGDDRCEGATHGTPFSIRRRFGQTGPAVALAPFSLPNQKGDGPAADTARFSP
jgi:hypothetical protein